MKTHIFLICFLVVSWSAVAQNTGLGKLDFPNSGSAAAQPAFVKGMLLLHSFEFEDAAEAFVEAQQTDPTFALAFWGEAMTYNHPVWFIQDKEAAMKALDRLADTAEGRLAKAATAIEKDWLRAIHILYGKGTKEANDIAYADFLATLHKKYPNNAEVASFYALALMGSSHKGRNMELYKKAGEVIEKVYAKNPDHPGALHYLIHAYDDPYNAGKALYAAFRYTKVAPAAAHALHMPTHIFVAMGMWPEVVASNIASWNAAEERRIRKDLTLQARGYHSFHWLQYGLLQLGETAKAKVLLDSMAYDTKAFPSKRLRNHLAMMQACYILESEDWKSDAQDIQVDFTLLTATDRAANKFAKAYAAIHNDNLAYAKATLLQMVDERVKDEPVKLDKDMALCHSVGGEFFDDMNLDSKTAAVIEAELGAFILFKEGKTDSAFKLMDMATDIEMQLPLEYGPPNIVKPTHELYGEMLLDAKRPEKAKLMFELALLRAPNRRLAMQGLEKSKSML